MNKSKKETKSAKLTQPASPPPEQQTLTLQQALDLAIQHHSAGDLPSAENIYQLILQTDPDHPDALHLLGVISHQKGENERAVDLITKALAIKPNFAEAHNSLSASLHELGKLEEAVAALVEEATPPDLKAAG